MKKVTRGALFEWHYVGNIYQHGKLVDSRITDGFWKGVKIKVFNIKQGYFLLDGDPCLNSDATIGRRFFYANNIDEQQFQWLMKQTDTWFFNGYSTKNPPRDIESWFHIYECTTNLEKLLCWRKNGHPPLPREFETLNYE